MLVLGLLVGIMLIGIAAMLCYRRKTKANDDAVTLIQHGSTNPLQPIHPKLPRTTLLPFAQIHIFAHTYFLFSFLSSLTVRFE